MRKKVGKTVEDNGYKVVNSIEPDTFGRYHGIVSDKSGNRFFVKAVVGRDSYSYRSLLAEVGITQNLYLKTKDGKVEKDGHKLFVPRTEKVIEEEDILCVISDYIEGERLLDQPSSVQAKFLVATLSLVEELGRIVRPGEIRSHMKRYNRLKLLFDLPFKLVKAVYLSPRLNLKLVKIAAKALFVLGGGGGSTLVHADINASNIIVSGREIYLTDWEEAGWGMPEYNIVAPLSVHWTDEIIRKTLLSEVRKKGNLVNPLLAYRTLVLLNQKIDSNDSRRKRDLHLLNFISSSTL